MACELEEDKTLRVLKTECDDLYKIRTEQFEGLETLQIKIKELDEQKAAGESEIFQMQNQSSEYEENIKNTEQEKSEKISQ